MRPWSLNDAVRSHVTSARPPHNAPDQHDGRARRIRSAAMRASQGPPPGDPDQGVTGALRVEDQARRPSARRLQPVRSAQSRCGGDVASPGAWLSWDETFVHLDNPPSGTPTGTSPPGVDPKQLRISKAVSGACWSGAAGATSAIAPGGAANHGGLAAGGDGAGEFGSAQRSRQVAAAHSSGSAGGSVWWSGMVGPAAAEGGARPLGGLVHRAGAASRRPEADSIGGSNRPRPLISVLPLLSQPRQYRSTGEIVRP
jgi:hypothetical protein